jgi:hypothetical protein
MLKGWKGKPDIEESEISLPGGAGIFLQEIGYP